MDTLPEHSPLGASGMERWQNCPGSYTLIERLRAMASGEHPEEEAEHTREGTAAHHIIEQCLKHGREAWEFIGETIEGVKVDAKLVAGPQMFLDHVLALMADADVIYIEVRISAPIHPLFYGRVDLAWIKHGTLYVRDYKNGVLHVDEQGPQPKYYAYGILHLHPDVRRVNLGIVQPNGFASEPIRTYEMAAEDIHMWAIDELLPAMQRAQVDTTLDAGDHCRFCPAKLVCPMLAGIYGAAAMSMSPQQIAHMTDAQLAMDYKLIGAVKMRIAAIEEEMYRRVCVAGRDVPGMKAVHKKANRVWKENAQDHLFLLFGNAVFSAPEFKSPAQIEAISSDAKRLVKEWAYTPEAGLTVALESDKRVAVPVKNSSQVFSKMIDGRKEFTDI